MQAIRKIHLIFKTHLDVGFTGLAREVVGQYFQEYIPRSLQLARELREAGGTERFIWTTGSWLIYEYLEQAPAPARAEMEAAIRVGDIAWHGLPVTTHSELMDPALFRYGLSLSQELDRRFGKHTIAAKMTDVPGHTRGIVPLLAEAGIQFLHIGVNPASTPPDVPPVFLWSAPDGSDVMVMYQKGSYGDLTVVPGLNEAIAFAHSGDNLGPQSARQIREIFDTYRQNFPGVEIEASTMDAFAAKLLKLKGLLPVVTQELGDTWIHGAASDPKKVSEYRELLRLLAGWRNSGRLSQSDSEYRACCRKLLLVPEHTWGMDEKSILEFSPAFSGEEFLAARSRPAFQRFESSWQEQRDYTNAAVQALGKGELGEEARSRLAGLKSARPDFGQLQARTQPQGVYPAGNFSLRFDPETGALTSLKDLISGREWAGKAHPLGLFVYETFSRADYERFYQEYILNKPEVEVWAIRDFTKPEMPAWAAHQSVVPRLRQFAYGKDSQGSRFVLGLEFEGEAVARYGCPREIWIEYLVPDQEDSIRCTLEWFEKKATRMAEAAWFSFVPRVEKPSNWRMDKLGQEISPLEVARNGNRKLHAVGSGVAYEDAHGSLRIRSLDAPGVAPGARALLTFNNRQPALSKGMHFLLHDNLWGTNFPMWYEDDARFRFEIELK